MSARSYVTVCDMFCGAGGSSIGVVSAGAELALAMNHWKLAIESHAANFSQAEHVLTDIRTADPRRYPSTDVLIASPECTAHTLAKGRKRKAMGQMDLWGASAFDPSEERSRATMWDVPRFAEHHRYALIIVENVVDACLYWEPFDAWLLAMSSLGYDHELVFLNSMYCHPTPQSRDRLYVVFWRRGNRKPDLRITPPAWCAHCRQDVQAIQAWKNPARRRGKYGIRNQYVYRCPHCHEMVQPYYYAAANAIDWSLRGERIGDRKTPLKPKTIERIQYGLAKFGREFVMGTGQYGAQGRAYPLDAPLSTQTGRQDKAIVSPFLMGMHGDYYTYRGMDEVIPTQVATGSTTALIMGQQSAAVARPLTEAAPTVSTGGGISLIVPAGGTWNDTARSVEAPFPTQTTREMYGLVQPPAFLLSFYGERHGTHRIEEPTPTVPGWANHALVGANREHNVPRPAAEVMATVVAGGNQHYLLVPYSGNNPPHEVSEPARTVTTHDREGLLGTAIEVEDCTFRMLAPHEIQAAMAFPSDYVVKGTARDRVRQLGNAVTPPVMSLLFQRCVETLAG